MPPRQKKRGSGQNQYEADVSASDTGGDEERDSNFGDYELENAATAGWQRFAFKGSTIAGSAVPARSTLPIGGPAPRLRAPPTTKQAPYVPPRPSRGEKGYVSSSQASVASLRPTNYDTERGTGSRTRGQVARHGDAYEDRHGRFDQQQQDADGLAAFHLPMAIAGPSRRHAPAHDSSMGHGSITSEYLSETDISTSSTARVRPEYGAVIGDVDFIEGLKRDNDADRRERAGEAPDAYYIIGSHRPPEFDLKFFGFEGINMVHIGRKTGCHLSVPSHLEYPKIDMWGQDGDIQNALADLKSLKARVEKDLDQAQRRVTGWAKIRAAPGEAKQRFQDNIARDALIRKKYRQLPQPGTTFDAVGTFLWPDYSISPLEALGTSTEGLDILRFDHRVYIRFMRSRKGGTFLVQGDDPYNVEEAVDRIFGKFCEIATNQRLKQPAFAHLVVPPTPNLGHTRVQINRAHSLVPRLVTRSDRMSNTGIVVYLGGPKPSGSFITKWNNQRDALNKKNEAFLRELMQFKLADLVYFRGHAQLAVYFGQAVLLTHKASAAVGDEFELEKFMEMTKATQMRSEVVRTLGTSESCTDEDVAEEIRAYMNSRNDFLIPVDKDNDPVTDIEIPIPVFFGTFEIRLTDEKGTVDVMRLVVEFKRVPGLNAQGQAATRLAYTVASRRWFMANAPKGPGENVPHKRKGPLDVKIMDLENAITAHVEISTWNTYPDTTKYSVFDEFTRSVGLEEVPDPNDPNTPAPELYMPDFRRKIKRIAWKNFHGFQVTHCVLKTKYRSWICNSNYIIELTKYESLPTEEVNKVAPVGVGVSFMGYSGGVSSQWGMKLVNDDWVRNFSQQSSLESGRGGTWSPDIKDFFGHSGSGCINGREPHWGTDGFKEFLHRISEVKEMIRDAQNTAYRKRAAAGGMGPGASGLHYDEEYDM